MAANETECSKFKQNYVMQVLVAEKFRSVKKVMLTVFWNIKGRITINFLEKGATVNSASCCLFYNQNSPDSLNDARIIRIIVIIIFVVFKSTVNRQDISIIDY